MTKARRGMVINLREWRDSPCSFTRQDSSGRQISQCNILRAVFGMSLFISSSSCDTALSLSSRQGLPSTTGRRSNSQLRVHLQRPNTLVAVQGHDVACRPFVEGSLMRLLVMPQTYRVLISYVFCGWFEMVASVSSLLLTLANTRLRASQSDLLLVSGLDATGATAERTLSTRAEGLPRLCDFGQLVALAALVFLAYVPAHLEGFGASLRVCWLNGTRLAV